MSQPQSQPQSSAPLTGGFTPLPTAVERPRPVDPKAGGGGDLWGPTNPRVTSPSRIEGPLQLLAQVADHAHKMNAEMLQLVTAITGEQAPAQRLRQAPLNSTGLLPAIAILAHEIEEAHQMTVRLIAHVRGRL